MKIFAYRDGEQYEVQSITVWSDTVQIRARSVESRIDVGLRRHSFAVVETSGRDLNEALKRLADGDS